MEKEKTKFFEAVKKPTSELERYNALQHVIKAIKEELETEYNLDREDFFLNYARPVEKEIPKTSGTELLDMLISGLDLEDDLGDFKKDLFKTNRTVLVPQIQTFRLSGYQSIKVLSFMLKLYQEEAEELLNNIKTMEA
jgi:hypothetical protein